MPLRRQHENSHNGCAQCKRRRVRCDEERPVCKRCLKYGGHCEYLAAPPQSASSQATLTPTPQLETSATVPAQGPFNSVASSSTQQPVLSSVPNEETDAETPDKLELMHYYTASTYLTISDSVEFQHIWQHTVPKEALSHNFLMHGILALAALHVAHDRPEDKARYIAAALRHHNIAIGSFRTVLQQVTEENCTALFGFSTTLLVLTLAFAQTHSYTGNQDPIGDLIQVFTLLQGTRAVLESAMKWIALGPLGPLVRRGLAARTHRTLTWNDPTQPFEQALDRLEACNERTAKDVDSQEMYSLAIQKLRDCVGKVRAYPGDRAAVVGWLVLLESSYVSSLESNEPMALVIIGHYGVLLNTLLQEWFVQDLGARVVEMVHSHLDDRWRPMVHWPMQQVELGVEGLAATESEHADGHTREAINLLGNGGCQ